MSPVEKERMVIISNLLSGDYDFEELTLRIFNFQYHYNPLYQEFCRHLGKHPGNVNDVSNISFLPISLFKTQEVKTGEFTPEFTFKSSGTTESGRSRHLVRDLGLYDKISTRIFEEIYGPLKDVTLLALLPSYLEQGDSSLICMIRSFIDKTANIRSQFYKYDFDNLRNDLENYTKNGGKILLWGVTYALLDFAEKCELDLEDVIVMETGGMKGRREELVRSEVHEILQSKLKCHSIHSEYGMTEMLSQAYSIGNGVFQMGDTLKILSFDVMDPLTHIGDERSGRCHVIDLANVDSCSFIATDDLCRTSGKSFEILGRLDFADVRGCNLLYRS